MQRTNRRKGHRSNQLDKYLNCIDKYNHSRKKKPVWLENGFSTWCTVRIQAWVRMLHVLWRANLRRRAVNQIAAIVIQHAYRNLQFRRKREQRPRPVTFQSIEKRSHFASVVIQLAWRRFCNKRVFAYFRDLVVNKLKGAPSDLLRTIIPLETDFMDRASGVHVRYE